MEDLGNSEILRKLLIKGVDCCEAILKLAEYIAIVHDNTSGTKLSEKEKAEHKYVHTYFIT